MVAYRVKSGDTMYKLAQRFGVGLQDLIRANPHIPNPNLIFPGQLLYIPIGTDHKEYPKEPKCIVPYLPQVLQMYYLTQIQMTQPMMPQPMMPQHVAPPQYYGMYEMMESPHDSYYDDSSSSSGRLT